MPLTNNFSDTSDMATVHAQHHNDLATAVNSAPKGAVLHLRQTTAQTNAILGDGTILAVTWGAVDLDTFGGWSSSPNPSRYTPNVAGWYLLMGACSFSGNATGYRQTVWRKNGGTINGSNAIVIANGANTSVVVARPILVQFNGSTDYIELGVTQNSGATLSTVVTTSNQPSLTATYMGS